MITRSVGIVVTLNCNLLHITLYYSCILLTEKEEFHITLWATILSMSITTIKFATYYEVHTLSFTLMKYRIWRAVRGTHYNIYINNEVSRLSILWDYKMLYDAWPTFSGITTSLMKSHKFSINVFGYYKGSSIIFSFYASVQTVL